MANEPMEHSRFGSKILHEKSDFQQIKSDLNQYRTRKKSSLQDCVSLRGHFAPRLFLLSSSFIRKKFERENSHGP